MEELLRDFGNYGFPMAVSAYLLLRVETKLERFAASVSKLAHKLGDSRGNSRDKCPMAPQTKPS